MKPITVFRPGRFKSMEGQSTSFSEGILARVAEVYDPKLHEAPLTIQHPVDPFAYGWVQKTVFADGHFQVEPHQVDPMFQEWVNSGKLKKVSAQFYKPGAAANPVRETHPDLPYLRAVGFLGSDPPAVKGLPDASLSYSDSGDEYVSFSANIDTETGTISFDEGCMEDDAWGWQTVGSLFRKMREFLIEQFGKDKADAVLADYSVGELEGVGRKMIEAGMAAPAVESYHEGGHMATTTDTQGGTLVAENEAAAAALEQEKAKVATDRAALDEEKKQLDAEKASFAEAKRAAKEQSNKDFLAGLVKAGRLTPGEVEQELSFMASLDDTADTMSFSEKDPTDPTKVIGGKRTPLAHYKATLAQRGQVVSFSEVAGGTDMDLVTGGDGNALAVRVAQEIDSFMESEREAGRKPTIMDAQAHARKKIGLA